MKTAITYNEEQQFMLHIITPAPEELEAAWLKDPAALGAARQQRAQEIREAIEAPVAQPDPCTLKPGRQHLQRSIESFLPAFNGFYGSYYEDPEAEAQEAACLLESAGFQWLEKAPGIDELINCDNAGHYQALSREILEQVEFQLLRSVPGLEAVKFQALRSPKEYNFRNDHIDAEFIFSDFERFRVWLFYKLEEHAQQWKEYLIEHYRSRSGFISFFPACPLQWLEDTQQLQEISGHYLGAFLSFLIEAEALENAEELQEINIYYAVSEQVSISEYCTLAIPEFKELPEEQQQALQAIESNICSLSHDLYLYANNRPEKTGHAIAQADKIEKQLYKEALEILEGWKL